MEALAQALAATTAPYEAALEADMALKVAADAAAPGFEALPEGAQALFAATYDVNVALAEALQAALAKNKEAMEAMAQMTA